MTLHAKIEDLLFRLATLSEAPSGNLEAHIDRSAPESSEPGSAFAVRDDDSHRDRSLYDWYREQFARNADNPERLMSLYLAGEREYLERTDPTIHARTVEKGSILAYSQEGYVVEGMAAEQVIADFEGVHALDVAIITGKREVWVEKIRRQHGRNPLDGRPRAEFLSWGEERRASAVERLAEECGGNKQKVADRLGIGWTTVSRYWPAALAV